MLLQDGGPGGGWRGRTTTCLKPETLLSDNHSPWAYLPCCAFRPSWPAATPAAVSVSFVGDVAKVTGTHGWG